MSGYFIWAKLLLYLLHLDCDILITVRVKKKISTVRGNIFLRTEAAPYNLLKVITK